MSKLEQYITEASDFKAQKKKIIMLAKKHERDRANLRTKMIQDMNKILDMVEKNTNEMGFEDFWVTVSGELDKIDDEISNQLM